MPKARYLIIEDDPFYQKYIADLLDETGVEILSALDGEEGLRLAREEKPDLILSDIEIPKIQGFLLLRTLKESPETRDIPVILMSGKVEKDLLDRLSQLNVRCEGTLVKPFSGPDLMDRIKKVFEPGSHPVPEDDRAAPVDGHFREQAAEDPGGGVDGAGLTPVSQGKIGEAGRIFVVDDSPFVLNTVSEFLSESGFEVRTFFKGEEAFKELGDSKPDLFLIDIQMPGMGGFVMCEMLRKEESTRDIPIILMSAVVDGDTFKRHSRLRHHADSYLVKPFMKSELLETVFRTIRAPDTDRRPEGKAGFILPGERDIDARDPFVDGQGPGAEQRERPEEIDASISQWSSRLRDALARKDQLEAEFSRVRTENEIREKELTDRLSLAAGQYRKLKGDLDALAERLRRSEEARSAMEAENRALMERSGFPEEKFRGILMERDDLKRDLAAALSAKAEIEDQVDIYFKTRKEADEKRSKTLAESLEKGQKEIEDLKRKSLQDKKAWEGEKAALEEKVEEGVRAKKGLEGERDLRIRAETEIRILREKVEELERFQSRFNEVREKCLVLEGKLEESERIRRETSRQAPKGETGVEGSAGEAALLNQRLEHLETTFGRTVREAQEVIFTQKNRENELREKLETIFDSLEEEKKAFREERDRWKHREEELRVSLEGALARSWPLPQKDVSGFYPMRSPIKPRPLEVMTPARKMASAIVWAVVFLAVFFAGFLVLSKFIANPPRQVSIPQVYSQSDSRCPADLAASGKILVLPLETVI
ncbi:MAG: response regulator [Proteobacteria bacterium]|nr:response regulator [Pseudomonadota bacterium]